MTEVRPDPLAAASDDGVTVSDIAVGGTNAFLVEPRAGGGGGAVLFLHWFDTEAPDGNRTQFLDEATELARANGIVSLLPQGRFPWAVDPTDAASDAARIRAEVEGHRAGLDLLAGRPDVAAGSIAVVGHDFGAMHGAVLAAEDDRVASVVAIAATPRWGDWFLPFWRIEGDRHDYLRALAPLDPITAIGSIAPRPMLLQFARNDYFIALMAAGELHRAAGEPAEMQTYDADHGMRNPQALADRRAFLERTLRQ